jgi:hypothetical protein
MNIDIFHKSVFVIFITILIVLYGFYIIKHILNQNKRCIIFKGQCPNGKYCGIDGNCVVGDLGDSCFLGLAQCKRPYNCYPNFKCNKF